MSRVFVARNLTLQRDIVGRTNEEINAGLGAEQLRESNAPS